MNNEYCPRECEHLSITEKRQELLNMITGVKIQHRCTKYIKPLYHMLAHPDLYKCEECLKEGNKECLSRV